LTAIGDEQPVDDRGLEGVVAKAALTPEQAPRRAYDEPKLGVSGLSAMCGGTSKSLHLPTGVRVEDRDAALAGTSQTTSVMSGVRLKSRAQTGGPVTASQIVAASGPAERMSNPFSFGTSQLVDSNR
jgi:hypothetical protein